METFHTFSTRSDLGANENLINHDLQALLQITRCRIPMTDWADWVQYGCADRVTRTLLQVLAISCTIQRDKPLEPVR